MLDFIYIYCLFPPSCQFLALSEINLEIEKLHHVIRHVIKHITYVRFLVKIRVCHVDITFWPLIVAVSIAVTIRCGAVAGSVAGAVART